MSTRPSPEKPIGSISNPYLTPCSRGELNFNPLNVSVDSQGVAICESPLRSTVMQLAAVRVGDGSVAEHVPLEMEEGRLRFPLPNDRPSKIGFFMGHFTRSIDQPSECTGVARLGNFPGMPLATYQPYAGYYSELHINLQGMKDTELDEKEWAHQIGLFDNLGFSPRTCRGIFSRTTQKEPGSTDWIEQRLVVTPSGMEDLVEQPGPDVDPTIFQFIGFNVARPLVVRDTYTMGGNPMFGATKGADLSTGFGRGFTTSGSMQRTSIGAISGMFEVQLTPAA